MPVVTHWTRAPRFKAHKLLVPYLRQLKSFYRDSRLTWLERWLGMYSDQQDCAIVPSRATCASSPLWTRSAVPLNIVRPLVDTAEAKITQAKPRPYFVTVGGTSKEQRQAKKLQKFADGIFDETRAYRLGARVFKDAALFGTGCIKVFTQGGRIKCERVLISDILVDEALGFDQNPPELAQVSEVSRQILKEAYPGNDEAIDKLPAVGARVGTGFVDLVEVFECWKLARSGSKGRRVVVIEGATLADEPWQHEYFPIAFVRWSEAPNGFYGLGIAHQVTAIQIELNRTVRSIMQNLHLHASPRILLPSGSGINPAHVTNAAGTILTYTGTAPVLWNTSVMPPEVYAWAENMYRKAFEVTGLSTQTAFAQKPAGVDAAKAMRELSDIQSDRLAPVSQRYENLLAIDMATRFVDCAEALFDTDKKLSVVAGGNRGRAERILWKDVRMPKDSYSIQLFPTNFLSRSPGGRFADIERLRALGVIDIEQTRKLFDFPDLQQIFDQENAARDNFEAQIDKILDEGVMIPPTPFDVDPTGLGLKLYKDAYNRARLDGEPEDRVNKLREWIEQYQDIVAAAQPPQPAEPTQEMGIQ